jgi:hypothetical protein
MSSRDMLCLLKMSGDFQMLFPAVTPLAEGLNLETLLTLNVGKPLTCFVRTLR